MTMSAKAVEGLNDLQAEFGRWYRANFPRSEMTTYVGTIEEIGELARIVVKRAQGIRGYDDINMTKKELIKELGDVFIKLMDIAEFEEIALADAIAKRWEDISKRNWQKDKIGHGKAEE